MQVKNIVVAGVDITRWQKHHQLESLPRSGRPEVLSRIEKRLLFRIARKLPKIEYDKLAEEAGLHALTEASSFRVLKMIKGGMAHPVELMHWMTVTHSRLPGWTYFGHPCIEEAVTTAPWLIQPIMKLVSPELYVSSSWMLYLALMLVTGLNQSWIAPEFLQRARLQSYLQLNFTLSFS